MGALFGGRREQRLAFPEPIVSPTFGGGGDNSSGRNAMAPDTALLVPSVWACVSLLANSVSMLPLDAFSRSGEHGVAQRLRTQPLILRTPAKRMTQSEWLHLVMVSLLMRGNLYGHVVQRDGYGYPTQIEVLDPDLVSMEIDKASGDDVYWYGKHGERKRIPTDDVWHVRGMTLPGRRMGLSPISYAAAVIGIDLSSRQFAGDYFQGGGVPKAVLSTEQPLNGDQTRTVKTRFLEATQRREPVVLSRGLKYHALTVTPEESQFLATQHADVDQIARYFGVPATMIGGSAGGSMTYTSVEMQGLNFLTYGASFWLKRIEDAMFSLLPGNTYVKFDTEALIRTDAETRAKVDVQLIAARVRTPTEVRAIRDLPPMTPEQKAEADLVPITITATGQVKAGPGLKLPPGDPAPVPADDPVSTP